MVYYIDLFSKRFSYSSSVPETVYTYTAWKKQSEEALDFFTEVKIQLS